MRNDVDRAIERILHANDQFLVEIGRLVLVFSSIEDCLVQDALELVRLTSDQKLRELAVRTKIEGLRIQDKRDFLKRVAAEIGRFYDVDHSRFSRVLDEFGSINRLRRSVVHGWIRWSMTDEKPILVDSHGDSVPAWPTDVLDLNLKVLNWQKRCRAEQLGLMRNVLRAYEAFADRFLRQPGTPPELRALFTKLKARISLGSAEASG